MKTILIILALANSVHAQDKKSLGTSEILKLSMAKVHVTKGFEKNWKKCFGTEVPDLDNFLEVPNAIVAANALKQLKEAPEASKACEVALEETFAFAAEAQCLLDEKVAQELYELTEDPDALSYFYTLEKKTAEIKSDESKMTDDTVHFENAQDLLDFFRKFNKKKIESTKKKKKK